MLSYFERFRPSVTAWICIVLLLTLSRVIPSISFMADCCLFSIGNFTQVQANLYSPRAEIDFLCSEVQDMYDLLRIFKVNKYKVDMCSERSIQRITEIAWPRKRVPDATMHLQYICDFKEGGPGKIIAKRGDVALVFYPPD